jgi:hypothetical protein
VETQVVAMKKMFEDMMTEIADTKAILQLEEKDRLLTRIKEKTAVVKTETKGTTFKEIKPSEDTLEKTEKFDTIVKYQMNTLA